MDHTLLPANYTTDMIWLTYHYWLLSFFVFLFLWHLPHKRSPDGATTDCGGGHL